MYPRIARRQQRTAPSQILGEDAPTSIKITVEPRFSVILAANFPLNSKFFSGYQKLILLSKITLNRGLPRFSVAF